MSDTPDESERRPEAGPDPIEDAASAAESASDAAQDAAGDTPEWFAEIAEERTESAPAPSALDEAIGRASTLEAPPEPLVPADAADALDAAKAADADAEAAALPDPVSAEAARRETFVPPTVVAPPQPVPPQPDPSFPPPAPVPQTVYVQAPAAPKTLGNRGFGTLVGLVATAAFAALYLAIAALLLLGAGADVAGDLIAQFASRPVFWVPILAFFVGFVVLVAIVNRGRWWAYVVFGLLVGAFVYASYVGGAMLTVRLWEYTFDEAVRFIGQRWLDPFAIVAGLVAREVVIWFGAWVARRGAVVEQRNRDSAAEYERLLAAGPNAVR